MARLKNAERKHYVQAYTPGESDPGDEWLELAKYISTIGDDTNEDTEDEAFYDGDGTPETTVTSVAEAYTPEGYYDPEDPAQELIAGLKRKTGDGRKIWHRVVRSDGKKEWVGRATVSAIVAGAGDASAYETFSCNIRFDRIPEETDLDNGDNGGGGVEG
jgi:hypothetical protein